MHLHTRSHMWDCTRDTVRLRSLDNCRLKFCDFFFALRPIFMCFPISVGSELLSIYQVGYGGLAYIVFSRYLCIADTSRETFRSAKEITVSSPV